jgi:L-fuconolactonase
MDTHGVEAVLLVCAEIDENPDNNAYGASAAARYPERVFPVVDVDSFWSPTHHRRGAADRLRRAVERFRPVGVTHYCGPHNDGWLRSEEADAFFAAATEHRLILSLAVGPAWQRDLRALAVRHPALPIVCHHLGAPDLLAAPGGGLAEVVASAVAPNVAIKASGFHYVSARGWDHPWPDALAVLRVLAESFGPRRLFWGSDFPASRRYTTYRQSLEAVRSHADFLDDDARRAVLGENLLRLLQTREPAG